MWCIWFCKFIEWCSYLLIFWNVYGDKPCQNLFYPTKCRTQNFVIGLLSSSFCCCLFQQLSWIINEIVWQFTSNDDSWFPLKCHLLFEAFFFNTFYILINIRSSIKIIHVFIYNASFFKILHFTRGIKSCIS